MDEIVLVDAFVVPVNLLSGMVLSEHGLILRRVIVDQFL